MPIKIDNASRLTDSNYHKQILMVIGGLLLLRISYLFISPYNLHGDEAQYWAWAQALDWGYYTKPPGIAAVIAFFTSIFGDAEWAVRIGSPILHSVTAYVIYRTARHLYSGATGFWASCFYILMPGVFYSSNIISTDVPLLLCWALALNAWVHLRDRVSWSRAVQLGVALGLGFLSKYAMLFFLPALILAVWVDQPTRRALFSTKGFLALSIFIACVVPNMIWNMNHDFATLTHTAANADYEAGSLPFKPLEFLEFFVGQFGLFGPVSLILLAMAIRAALKNQLLAPAKFLTFFVLSPVLIISAQALISGADLNWAVTAYVAGSILAAHYCVKNWPHLKNWTGYNFIGQTLICLLALGIYASPQLVDGLGRANDVKRTRAWPATVNIIKEQFEAGHKGVPYAAIAVDKRLHFYAFNYYGLTDGAPLYMWMFKSKPNNNHAEITHPLPAGAGPFLIVNYHQNKPKYLTALKEDFARLEPLQPLTLNLGGGIERNLSLWVGYGYNPTQTR